VLGGYLRLLGLLGIRGDIPAGVFDGLSFFRHFGSSFSLGLIGSSPMGIAFAHWRYSVTFLFGIGSAFNRYHLPA
jgi:hypothetical protein